MREIIFRGKSLVTKEWVYGDLFQHGKEVIGNAYNNPELIEDGDDDE